MSMLVKTAVLTVAVSFAASVALAQNGSVLYRIGGDPADNKGYARLSDFGMSRGLFDQETPYLNFVYKRPGRAKYNNIVMKRSPLANEELDAWINDVCDGKNARKSVSIIYIDRSRSEKSRYNFFEAWPCRITFPGCDANSYTPRNMEVEFLSLTAPIREPLKGFSNGDIPQQNQKKWMPANFRLKIDGLDAACARVNKIDSFSIKQGIADLDGDGAADFTCDDLVLHMPKAAADAFLKWSPDELRGGSIEFRDISGQTVRTLRFTSLGVGQAMDASSNGDFEVRLKVSGPIRWMAPEA